MERRGQGTRDYDSLRTSGRDVSLLCYSILLLLLIDVPDRFRWVFCQLDTLRRCMPSSIRKALDELPTTLDETYERALQGIPKEKRQHAHHLFQCLVVAIRPLRVEELAELFAIEFDQDSGPSLNEGWRPENPEIALLSACSTLIAVIENNGSKIVQFSHFSVKEYLTSGRLRTSEIGNVRYYHIPLDAAHTVLAQACITVLLQLDENVDKKRLETFPLAYYAAQRWVDHAKYQDVASQFQGPIEQVFNPSKPYFAAWTWIHDIDLFGGRKTRHILEERPKQPETTALYYAVLCGFSGLANHLVITHGEDVNAKCGYHGSPLHAASFKGHLDAVRVLLTHGVDVNTTNKHGRTPLCSAYAGGHLDVMRLLIEHEADVDADYNGAAGDLLHDASYDGRLDFVHLLLQQNIDVNIRNHLGNAPLHLASMMGHARVAQLLLEHGAIVDAQGYNHYTPLYYASACGHLAVVQVLLGHGADVHIREGDNLAPVQVARSYRHVEVAQLLLEHGAEKE
jgi:ankyrin repeat protein